MTVIKFVTIISSYFNIPNLKRVYCCSKAPHKENTKVDDDIAPHILNFDTTCNS